MLSVLLADDHRLVREGFASLISAIDHLEIVGFANNGKEVLDQLKVLQVDIVFMDINMPEMNGVECCKRVKKKYPDVKVIALSMLKEESFVKRMFASGASAYLLKDDTQQDIIDTLEAIKSGKQWISPQLHQDLNRLKSVSKRGLISLTKREKQILQVLSEGLSNKETANTLFISSHTVDSHVKNMLSKFQAKNKVELVKLAIEKGFI